MSDHAVSAAAGISDTGHARSVFVTNDALSGHIGTAQVLPYLEGLAARGHVLGCISVETRVNDWDREGAWRKRLEAADISSHSLTRSAGPFYKLERFLIPSRLARALEQTIAATRPDLIHCRSYMPLSAVMKTSVRHGVPFLFDMRGFWIDERIEGGAWDKNRVFWQQVIRRMRHIESQAISSAGAIITLTEDARDVIQARPDYRGTSIEVIPCSVRGDVFKPLPLRSETRASLGIDSDCCVIAYLGSAGAVYRLDVVYRIWKALTDRGTKATLLFIGDHDFSYHAKAASRVGIALDPQTTFFTKVPHHLVPEALSAADIGISPRLQGFSSLGVSATKVGEYLSCGLPVVTNVGVGDVHRIIADGENGFLLPDFQDTSIARCADTVLAGLEGGFLPREEISRRAGTYFGMDQAISTYDDVYRRFARAGRS